MTQNEDLTFTGAKYKYYRKVAPVQLDINRLKKIIQEIEENTDPETRGQRPSVTVVGEVRDDLGMTEHDHENAEAGEFSALPSLDEYDTRHTNVDGPNSIKTQTMD